MSAAEKDKLILALRRKGYTYAQIGKSVGMSKNGVRYALIRAAQGRPGRSIR
jgi:SOS response regulatory protein OraA/RecX